MKIPVARHISTIVPYPPGKPIEELEREYGIQGSIKLASNENPLGPSPRALAALNDALSRLHRYPDGSGYYLRQKISRKYSVPFDGIVLGNGSNEVIEFAIRAFVQPGDRVIVPEPSFLLYKLVTQMVGGETVSIPLRDYSIDLQGMLAAVDDRTRVLFLTNPNNPTGTLLRKAPFDAFLAAVPPEVLVVLDEAYIEFARDDDTPQGFDYIHQEDPCLLVLRTFSKAYGLAGLRIGYGVTNPSVATYLNRVHQPFNTGSLSQAAAIAALDDEEFLSETLRTVWEGMEYLCREMDRIGLNTLPSQANFFLIQVPVDGKKVFEHMLRQGVIIRPMNAYGLPRHIRVNVGRPEENRRFVKALTLALDELSRTD